jgi:hypothetical protein
VASVQTNCPYRLSTNSLSQEVAWCWLFGAKWGGAGELDVRLLGGRADRGLLTAILS